MPRPVAQLGGMEPPTEKVPQSAAQLLEKNDTPVFKRLVVKIPWGHNILLIEKVKDLEVRYWYMQQTIEQGWSLDTLAAMIKSHVHERQGKAVSNFSARLPSPQSEMARELLKDPYLLDFLTIEEPFHERELETGLVRHLEKFLLELGSGFAFVGRQLKTTLIYLHVSRKHLTSTRSPLYFIDFEEKDEKGGENVGKA